MGTPHATQRIDGSYLLRQRHGAALMPECYRRERDQRRFVERACQVVGDARHRAVADRHPRLVRVEQHKGRVCTQPGRRPVGGAPETDATVLALPPRQNAHSVLDLAQHRGAVPFHHAGLASAIQCDQRTRDAEDLFRAIVRIDAHVRPQPADDGQGRRTRRQRERRPRRVDVRRQAEHRLRAVAHDTGNGVRARMERGLDRNRDPHRVGVSGPAHIEAEGRRVAADRAERKAHLFAPAVGHAHALRRPSLQLHTLRLCTNVHLRGTGRPPIHHGPGHHLIAGTQETRKRRSRDQRARHQHRRLPTSVSITLRDGDCHHAEGREVVGKLRGRDRAARIIGDDTAEEERRGSEPRAENVRRIGAASTSRCARPLLSLRNLRCDRYQIAGETHPDAALTIHQVERIGGAVAGEREHAFVHRPQRDLGPLTVPACVAHLQVDTRRVAGAVLRRERPHLHRQPLHFGSDTQLGVSDAHRRPPRIIQAAGRRAAAPHHDHRHEGIRNVGLGDRDADRGGTVAKSEAPLLDHPLAFDRQPCLGIGEWRGDHHRRRVADVVALAVGDEIHHESRAVAPGYPAAPGRPTVHARAGAPPGGVGGGEGQDVAAAGRWRERARDRLRRRGHAAPCDRIAHPFADDFGDSVPLAPHLVPLAAHDRPAHLHSVHPFAGGPHRDDADPLLLASAPEVPLAQRPHADVERCGVYCECGRSRHRLTVHVGDGGDDRQPRRAAAPQIIRRNAHMPRPRRVERVHATGDHPRTVLTLSLPPSPGLADGEPLGAGNLERPGGDRGLHRSPLRHRTGHRCTEQVARLHVRRDRVARMAGPVVAGHVDEELRRPVLGHAIHCAGDLRPHAAAVHADGDRIRAEPCIVGDAERALARAERGQPHDRVEQWLFLPAEELPAHGVALRHLQGAKQSRAHDRLGVHLLAGPVDATLGEDCGGSLEPPRPPLTPHIEAPGAQIGIPRADADHRAIVAKRDRDQPLETGPVLFVVLSCRLRSER